MTEDLIHRGGELLGKHLKRGKKIGRRNKDVQENIQTKKLGRRILHKDNN